MKMNEKKTEELMTSLSPRFIREFADPAVIERKSHPEWAIILFLVLSLSVIGVVVGGSKANAGNTVPTEKVVIPKGTTPLEIKDYTILPGYEITRLYVMGVKTDHPEYQKACQAIRDADVFTEKMNKEAKAGLDNIFKDVDLDLGVPQYYFAAARKASLKELQPFYFIFPVIREGRLFSTIVAQRHVMENGESRYSLIACHQNGYLPLSENPLPEDEKELIYILNTCDCYAYEALSGLTSADNPLYVTGQGRIDVEDKGAVVIGNTLYRLETNVSYGNPGSFEELSLGLDISFISDMGFEPELKVWPLGK